jgi:transcriptional antiterminator RfaH
MKGSGFHGADEGLLMSVAALNDQAEWYAVRTKPKEEERADINLRSLQVETFAPKVKERRFVGYRGHNVSKPLFSSYIFAHFDARRQLHKINYTRGVLRVVSFGGHPISIDDRVISFIREQIDEDGYIRKDEELKLGDRVRINSGPFESLVGIFERRTKDKDRVKILLDAITYQSHLLIEREMVEKVS